MYVICVCIHEYEWMCPVKLLPVTYCFPFSLNATTSSSVSNKSLFYPTAKVIDNTRYKSLQFQITEDNVVHGFGGYFEAFLYKDIMLSIKPETHSLGMFSWFPILFPLRVSITDIELLF